MKIANWNIEWMNDWFTPISAGAPGWRQENAAKGIADVAALVGRVAQVIKMLAADVIAIQEGPSRAGEMQLFVDDFIDGIRDRPLLLDHILLSPSLYWGALRNARIEHEAFEAVIDPAAKGRMGLPSDHRPQTASLEF